MEEVENGEWKCIAYQAQDPKNLGGPQICISWGLKCPNNLRPAEYECAYICMDWGGDPTGHDGFKGWYNQVNAEQAHSSHYNAIAIPVPVM